MARKLGERGKRVKKGKQKNDAFYRIRIIMFLSAFGESRITDFEKKREYGVSSMNRVDLSLLLKKMIVEKWIKKSISKDAKNVKKYSLIKRGREMVNYIKELRNKEEDHPLFEVETFYGVKSLD